MKHTFALIAALLLLLSAALPAAERPNILWLIAEDFGPHLDCYGTKEVTTPNLDRLAARGARYTHFYNGAVCPVSRSVFMTGMYATSIGAYNHRTQNKQLLPDGVRPELRATGYGVMNFVGISCGGFADLAFGALRDHHVPLNVIFGVFASTALGSVVLVLLIRPKPAKG
jgi:hypothetical protein